MKNNSRLKKHIICNNRHFFIAAFFCFFSITATSQQFSFKDNYQEYLSRSEDLDNDFSFDRLLNKFEHHKDFTVNEKIALLIGSRNHKGYGSDELFKFENEIISLLNEKKYHLVIKKANQTLKVFPLSITALVANWESYDALKNEEKSDLYYNKAAILFDGMNKSGGFSRNSSNNPIIASSESDIKQYANLYAGGAGFEFKKKIQGENGILMIIYSSILGDRYFVIMPN